MIKDLYIENFRGFDKLKIDNIKKINFLVGKNNCGKTSILEAIAIISGMPDCSIAYHINAIRRIDENSELKNLFYNFDYKNNNIEFNYNFDSINHNLMITPVLKKDISFDNKTDDINELEYKLNIEFEDRNIILETPTEKELEKWIKASGYEIKKFFNTSRTKI